MSYFVAFSFVYYSNVSLSGLITSFGADFADIDNKYFFLFEGVSSSSGCFDRRRYFIFALPWPSV